MQVLLEKAGFLVFKREIRQFLIARTKSACFRSFPTVFALVYGHTWERLPRLLVSHEMLVTFVEKYR